MRYYFVMNGPVVRYYEAEKPVSFDAEKKAFHLKVAAIWDLGIHNNGNSVEKQIFCVSDALEIPRGSDVYIAHSATTIIGELESSSEIATRLRANRANIMLAK